MPVPLPPAFLAFASRSPEWAAWLDELPRILRDLVSEWDLRVDGSPAHGEGAVVVPVLTPDGERAVLKVTWPHWEAEHEHLALQAWKGDGAIRLLRADPHRFAMLVERVHPIDLTTVPVLEACEIVAAFYPRLHVPAGPQFRTLSDQASRWAKELLELPASAPVPRRYVEQASSLARDFASDPACDGRLIHTDLHYFNVLAADREPWLVIDPKPLSGDPHYEVAPLLWNRWDEIVASGNVREAVRRRFHAMVDAAEFDEERARDWIVVREMVNVKWTLEEATVPLDTQHQEWITTAIAIAKAVQD